MVQDYSTRYLKAVRVMAEKIDLKTLERMISLVLSVRSAGGRLFFIGVGGGAANAGHAVNDFRKLVGVECYAPTDNAPELTARINDDGWETSYANWLAGSRLSSNDGLFVFSVGGGDLERNVSPNIVRAVELAKQRGAKILGVVGRDGGFTAKMADACVILPTVHADMVTPLTESFQSVICHLLVSHPELKLSKMKWESLS